MPKGIPKKGFRRSRKLSEVSMEEIERNLVKRSPDFLEKLEELTKPLTCSGCGNTIRGPDRDAIIYLCNRALGMPKQRQEIDVTQTYQFNADQLDTILRNNLPQVVQAYESEIRELLGDYEGQKLLPLQNPSNTD